MKSRQSSVRCPAFVVPLVAEPIAEKRRPKTPFHGRFSLHHSMAEAILSGGLDKRSFAEENLRSNRYNAIADKVEVRVDETATDRRVLGGTVEFRFGDGSMRSLTIEHMRGMPQNPMSTDDIARKFRLNAAGLLSDSDIDRVIEDVLELERVSSIKGVLSALSIGQK